MAAGIRKRSLTIAGHRTSVSLEDAFWRALREAAGTRGQSVGELVAEIDAGRGASGLSSAIRIFLLDHYRGQARSKTVGPIRRPGAADRDS